MKQLDSSIISKTILQLRNLSGETIAKTHRPVKKVIPEIHISTKKPLSENRPSKLQTTVFSRSVFVYEDVLLGACAANFEGRVPLYDVSRLHFRNKLFSRGSGK